MNRAHQLREGKSRAMIRTIISRLFAMTLFMSRHKNAVASYYDESIYKGLAVVLDEPYDGAIYVRSIHDPFFAGVVDPAGSFRIRFHVECSRVIPKIEGCVLQGQINSAWVSFGPLAIECGGKYVTAMENMWPPVGDDGEGDPPSTLAPTPPPSGGLLSGLNSFGLSVIGPDG